MAVAMGAAHLGADHAQAGIAQFIHVRRFNGFGETGPSTAAFVFVGRGKQRLARDDVDVDARFLVVQKRTGAGAFGAALLGHAIFFG